MVPCSVTPLFRHVPFSTVFELVPLRWLPVATSVAAWRQVCATLRIGLPFMKLLPDARWLGCMTLSMLTACASHVQQPEQSASTFAAEWARAVADPASGTAGEAWERGADPAIELAYGVALDSCDIDHYPGDTGAALNQRFVLDIAQDGAVRQVWSETDSPLLTCVRASLGRARFPPPPFDGYRQGLLLDLTQWESQEPLPRLPRPAQGSINPDEARRLAIADTNTEEGVPYMQLLATSFAQTLDSTLLKCMAIPLLKSERSLRGYGLIFEVSADGTPQRVLVTPEPELSAPEAFQSPRADCLRGGLSRARLTAPPWDGFWVYMGLDNPPPGIPGQ